MKKIIIVLMAMALVLNLSQCKKEQPTTNTESNTVSITLDIQNNGGSRMDVNTSTGEVTFVYGDVVYVASGGKYIGTLTHNGTNFVGTITDPCVGELLHFYFLGNVTPAETLVAGTTQNCSVVISNQTEHLPVIEYAPSNENYDSGATAYTAMLLNKCALVKFNVTTVSEAATCITGMKNKVTVSFAENTLTPSQEGNGVITLPAGNGEKWAILLPQEAVEAGLDGTAYSEDGAYKGTRGAVPAIRNNGYLTMGIDIMVSTPNVVHEYVDLGLPSGTLWATCNVGANAPEEYGDYFAWGETQPKDTYNWSTYQYCNGSDNTLTKYCNNSNYGYNSFTDTLTVLLPEDDAATANWGTEWRMPTIEEWDELYSTTSVTLTTQNGVSGRLFTASNGNRLFLPAAGRRHDSSLYYAGNNGDYWSNSPRADFPSAYHFYFSSAGYGMGPDGYRDYGRSVRAVRPVSQNVSFVINATANPVEGGLVYGGGSYQEGAECTLTAIVYEGYVFINWTENDVEVSTETTFTFTVNRSRNLVANFAVSGGNDHAYVDLGLPSGLLWAICNVGANNPEDYGYYFAWGETLPKNIYNWDTYQFCMGSDTSLTRYCNKSFFGYNGFTDDLTILLPEDDAATANWGEDWRMPIREEWQELYNNTSVTWTMQNGVNGLLFTASNGNSLFLPAAGYRWDNQLRHAGSYGHYWSSSRGTGEPDSAEAFVFSDYYSVSGDSRNFGHSVRAVRSMSQN